MSTFFHDIRLDLSIHIHFIECDGHTFGQNCSELCGHCLNDEQCHHVDGNCTNACDLGYHGTNCTQGKRDIED